MLYNITYTLPTGSADTTLFDSTVHMGGKRMVPLMGIERMMITLQNSQAGSLKAYWSADGGTTWNLYDTQTAAIPAAGLSSGPYDYLIDGYADWRLIWTNGGTNQTVFTVSLAGIEEGRYSAV